MKASLKQILKKNKISFLLLYPIIWIRRSIATKKENSNIKFLKELSDIVIGGSVIVKVPDFRGTFEIDVRSDILEFILIYRDYERDIVKLIKKYIHPDKDVVDVGANIGLHSVLFSQLINPGQRVLSVEPTPNALKYLKSNLKRNNCNGKVIVFNGVAAEMENGYKLNIIEGKEEYSSIGRMNHPKILGMPESSIFVAGDTIDNLVASNHLTPGLIKIDTEGAEFRVLSGAKEVIKEFRPIILSELCEKLLNAQGSSCQEVYGLLNEFNYQILDAYTLKTVTGPIDGEIIAIPV